MKIRIKDVCCVRPTTAIFRMILSMLLLIGGSQVTFGATHYVTNTDDSGAGSLRDAVSGAAAGDSVMIDVSGTILVSSGAIAISNELTIIGPSAKHITLTRSINISLFTIGSSGLLHLESVGFKNSVSTQPVIYGASGASLDISYCLFEDNSTNCIQLNGAGTNLDVLSCSFINNNSPYNGVAISCNAAVGTIANSTFFGNNITGSGNGAALFLNSANMNVTNNTFVDNTKAGSPQAIRFNISGGNVFRNNIIYSTSGTTSQNIGGTGGCFSSDGGNVGNESDAVSNGFTGPGDVMTNSDPGLISAPIEDGWGLKYLTFQSNFGPAIDVSNNLVGLPTHDARRVWRVQDSGGSLEEVDAGAVEFCQFKVAQTGNTAPNSMTGIIDSLSNGNFVGKPAVVFEITGTGPFLCDQSFLQFNLSHSDVIINGFSQEGSQVPGPGPTLGTFTSGICAISVENTQGNSNSGFYFGPTASNCIIAGIAVTAFPFGSGIVNDAANLEISGCHIGVNYNGTTENRNFYGVSNRINGTSKIGSGEYAGNLYHSNRNVISGNENAQILNEGNGDVEIQHNILGLSSDGLTPVFATGGPFSSDTAIVVRSSSTGRVLVGDTDPFSYNLITGQNIGIAIFTGGNEVFNAIIGSGITADFTNSGVENNTGVLITGALASGNLIGSSGKGNTIIGNNDGVKIDNGALNNLIYGNNIGVSIDGDQAVGNLSSGVLIDGFGTTDNKIGTPGEGNIISGNDFGVTISGGADGNLIQDNIIGLSNDGTFSDLGNSAAGIIVTGSSTNTNKIGGSAANEGNFIGFNTEGILLADNSASTIIDGNYIGLKPDGVSNMGNSNHGIYVNTFSANNDIGSCGVGNYISFNATGIQFEGFGADLDTVLGNKIGIDINGADAGNSSAGIRIKDNTADIVIGNVTSGCGNEIAFNGVGIVTDNSSGASINSNHTFSGNSMHDNVGIGIDLDSDGDNGPGGDTPPIDNNEAQTNLITSLLACGAGNTVMEYEPENSLDALVEVFKSSDSQEGDSLIGQYVHTGATTGTIFYLDLGVVLPVGMEVVATFTYEYASVYNNTSEFSPVKVVTAPTAVLSPTISQTVICQGGTPPTLSVTGNIGLPVWYSDPGLSNRIGSGANLIGPSTDANAPGLYSYYVVDSVGGCVGPVSAAVTLTVNGLPTATATNITGCIGLEMNTAFSVSAGATASWIKTGGPSIGTGTGGSLDITFTPSVSGTATYTVSGMDGNGCTSANPFPFTIEVYDNPTVDAGSDVTICEGGSFGLNSSAIGGTPTYNLNWDVGTGASQSVSPPVGVTTYEAYVSDANGCVDTNTIDITVVTLPILTIPSDVTYCYAAVTSAISFTSDQDPNVTFTWTNDNPSIGLAASGSGTINSFSANNISSVPEVATITVTPTNSVTGCLGNPQSFIITVNPIVPALATHTSGPHCEGDDIDLVGSGGVGYTWTGPNGFTSLAQSPTVVSATVLDAGVYSLVVTDTDGCTNVASTSPVVNQSPIANAGNDTTICDLTNVILNGSATLGDPGYTFSWDNGVGAGATHTLSPTINTTYILTAFDVNGCSGTDDIVVTIQALPTVLITPSGAICSGQSVTYSTSISGNAPYTFDWDLGTQFIDSTIANATTVAMTSGSYNHSLLVSDANGCVNSDVVVLQVNVLPTASLQTATDISCNGLTDGVISILPGGSYSYLWSNSDIGQNPSNLSAGSYTLTMTDVASFCVGTAGPFTVNEPTIISPTMSSTDVVCNGASNGTVTASGGGGSGSPYGYSWYSDAGLLNNIGFTPTITGLGAGWYYVQVSDANACSVIDSVEILEPLTPLSLNLLISSNYNGTEISCSGAADGIAVSTPTGGTAPYTNYMWVLGASTVDTDSIGNGLAAGIYSVSVTDANGCSNTESITLNEPAAVSTNAGVDTSFCVGSSVMLNASATGGTAPVTITWLADPTLSSTTIANPVASPNVMTSYYATGTDINGCNQADIVEVGVNALPTISVVATDVTCNGSADGTLAVQLNTGVSPYQYSLDNGVTYGGPTAATNYSLTFLVPGTNTVVVMDQNNCVSNDSVIIIAEPAALIMTPSIASDTCARSVGQITIATSGGVGSPYTYSIDNGANYLSSATFPGLLAGNYDLLTQDANGCMPVNQPVTVGTIQGSSLSIGSFNGVSCFGLSDGDVFINISNQPPGVTTFSWTEAASSFTANTQDINMLDAGTYKLVSQDGYGCLDSVDVLITEPSEIVATFTNTDESCLGFNDGSLDTLSVSGGVPSFILSWTQVGGGAVANPSAVASGDYVGLVTDQNGCTDSGTITVSSGTGIAAPSIDQLPGVTGAIEYCESSSVQYGYLTATSNTGTFGNFNWTIGSNIATTDSILIDNTNVGVGWIYVTETVGACSSLADSVLLHFNLDDLSILGDNLYCTGETMYIEALGSGTMTWQSDTDILDATVNPIEVNPVGDSSTYYVQMILNDCFYSDSILVTLAEDCGTNTVGNNAFSPDGDGVNDIFQIDLPLLLLNDNRVTIVNRWGDVINEYENYNNQDIAWDGKNSKGEDLATGTYFYIIEIPGEELKTTGWIQIVR